MTQGDGPLTTRGRHLATQRGLGHRFRALFSGTAVSLLGNYVAYLTIPLLVVQVVGAADEAAVDLLVSLPRGGGRVPPPGRGPAEHGPGDADVPRRVREPLGVLEHRVHLRSGARHRVQQRRAEVLPR